MRWSLTVRRHISWWRTWRISKTSMACAIVDWRWRNPVFLEAGPFTSAKTKTLSARSVLEMCKNRFFVSYSLPLPSSNFRSKTASCPVPFPRNSSGNSHSWCKPIWHSLRFKVWSRQWHNGRASEFQLKSHSFDSLLLSNDFGQGVHKVVRRISHWREPTRRPVEGDRFETPNPLAFHHITSHHMV